MVEELSGSGREIPPLFSLLRHRKAGEIRSSCTGSGSAVVVGNVSEAGVSKERLIRRGFEGGEARDCF